MIYNSALDGAPGTTVTFSATTNTAYTLAAMGATLTDLNGQHAHMALISIETQSARLAFVADATDALGHLKAVGAEFKVSGSSALKELTLRNAVDGSNFTAQITPFFSHSPAA